MGKRNAIILLCALASAASAGTLSGRFVGPLGTPIANGTLTFQLSQGAVSTGNYAVAPAMASCFTSADGSVVGLPNLTVPAAGSAIASLGTLPAGTYYVELTYTGSSLTETLASPETTLTLVSNGRLVIDSPVLQPAAAAGYNVYIGTAPGTETKQGTGVLGTSYVQSGPLALGSVPPSFNTTTCGLVFNDALLPSYTYYGVTLKDSAGNTVAGYPENWYLAGTTEDVSLIIGLSSNPGIRFPMPILANWPSTSAQSLNSNLTLNYHFLQQAGNVGPGSFSAYWSNGLPAIGTTIATWTPSFAVNLTRISVNAQAGGSGGVLGSTLSVTDGTSTCSFANLLAGPSTATSQPSGTGHCTFAAGAALALKLSADDHTTAPAGVNISLEMTSN